ncbi:MAG TPA: winged helix-turn-helix domain-containing protein [Pyrinomonadaceae bacterium]|nr:winged helix-turn-helix domain-containing protein [Pyrinomonadaceae bacterium]
MSEQNHSIYEFGPFRLDARKRLLRRNGEIVPLKPKAFDTLLALVEGSGRVIEKDELMRRVWGDTAVEEGNLTFNISSLRKALGERPNQHEYIVTIPGEGYRFVAGVRAAGFDELEVRERTRVTIEEQEETSQAVNFAEHYAIHAAVRSIAVLPFKPLVADSRDESLELGMADTLITRLSSAKEIIVRPLSAVRNYGGLEQDPVVAGREQRVDAVLDGSIQKAGDKVRVTVRLFRVADRSQLWARQFDEELTHIFAVQDSISQRVVTALAVTLTGEERKLLTKRDTESTEAYQLYLLGRYHWSRFYTAESARKAIEYFNKAIDRDANYALPYAGLANAYILLGQCGTMPAQEAYPKARDMALRALEKDELLAEAHTSLAAVSMDYDWNWTQAERHFIRAIELNPNSSDARLLYCIFLAYIGRSSQSVAEAERAVQLDPISAQVNASLGEVLYVTRSYDQAIEQLNKTLEIDSQFWFAHFLLGLAYTQKGMRGRAIDELQNARELSGNRMDVVGVLGCVYALDDQRDEAQGLLDEMQSLSEKQYVSPIALVAMYMGLGEADRAFAWVDKMFEDRQWHVWLLKREPLFDPLRLDPRFTELLKRAGLVP